ncbi:MAG: PIN domain-containing protein [Thermoplasmata archaeon]
MIAIVDSFAWIELLAGSVHEERVRETLTGADVVVTPDLVLTEVARELARDGVGRSDICRKVMDISTLSEVASITVEVALGVFEAETDLRRSAKTRQLNAPGLSDPVTLSTARARGGLVLTGDPHFERFRETEWLGS